MKIISHRMNQIDLLNRLPEGQGAEIDLRTYGSNVILNHEPFENGDLFEDFLAEWSRNKSRGTLILNPKEDGLESKVLDLLKIYRITDFFFLDLTLPTTVKWAVKNNMSKIAVRVSEYEPLESALKFAGKVQWAWLDSFTGEVPSTSLAQELRKHFQVCLVSPELQGYDTRKIQDYLPLKDSVDAVCTKNPALWTAQ